jgi:hypothetical protein
MSVFGDGNVYMDCQNVEEIGLLIDLYQTL